MIVVKDLDRGGRRQGLRTALNIDSWRLQPSGGLRFQRLTSARSRNALETGRSAAIAVVRDSGSVRPLSATNRRALASALRMVRAHHTLGDARSASRIRRMGVTEVEIEQIPCVVYER